MVFNDTKRQRERNCDRIGNTIFHNLIDRNTTAAITTTTN